MRFGRREKGEEERVTESTEMGLALLLGPLWTNQLQQPFPQRVKVTAILKPCIYIYSHLSVLPRVVLSGVGKRKRTGRRGRGLGWEARNKVVRLKKIDK